VPYEVSAYREILSVAPGGRLRNEFCVIHPSEAVFGYTVLKPHHASFYRGGLQIDGTHVGLYVGSQQVHNFMAFYGEVSPHHGVLQHLSGFGEHGFNL